MLFLHTYALSMRLFPDNCQKLWVAFSVFSCFGGVLCVFFLGGGGCNLSFHFLSFCLHLQSGQPSIPCLVFIISPSVSWFLLTLPRPRCLSVSLPGLLSVHLRTCFAFPLFLNATLTLLYAGFSSRHPLALSLCLPLSFRWALWPWCSLSPA